MLRLLQQTHRLLLIGTGWHVENDRLMKLGELRDLFDLVEHGVNIATQTDPVEFRRPGDSTKTRG